MFLFTQLKQKNKVQHYKQSLVSDTAFRSMVHSRHSSEKHPRKENGKKVADERAGQNGKKIKYHSIFDKILEFCGNIVRIVGMVVLGACKYINTTKVLIGNHQ